MPTLAIHRDAADDLQAIKADGDVAGHAAILAFLQQAKCDRALLETLSEDWFGEGEAASYSVRKVVSLHRRGRKLWRVRVLTLKGPATKYRVLYTFTEDQRTYFVLGVVPREFAYDQDHPRIRRLIAVYDGLGIA